MKITKRLCVLLLISLIYPLFSQNAVPAEMRGDQKYRKKGIHNGNLVETLFYNYGEIAYWQLQPSCVWPKGTNQSYMDGATPLVVTQVVNHDGDTLYMCEAGYRERMDTSPMGVDRGWQPRPGYANPLKDYISMSDNPISWPDTWADKDDSWNGYWNGYFGKRTNADQESYFVMDDNCDDGHDFYPDSTDHSRRGLGLCIKVRGFQWSNMMAEDLIFWHYDITNESTTEYKKMIFGIYNDVGIGGADNSNDDNAFFVKDDNMVYSWDTDGLGDGGWDTGYCGYAFLESPGNPYNNIDDDGDGEENSPTITTIMIAGEIPDNGIDDNGNGLIDEAEMHIGFKYADGEDNNGNGLIDEMIDERRDDLIDNDGDWDPERDDVGADGIAGSGDYGEGDGEATSGEPNFDATDKDESDQIGLTAFDIFTMGAAVEFKKDEDIWNRISYSHFDSGIESNNVAFLFGSGPFPLKPLQTERFSMCIVLGENLEDISRNKQTVQQIYNNNYNFARPPDKPTVWSVAGDKKVTLYWDDIAEKSYDEFSDPPEDFEGYKIYKSTEPAFLDARYITNAFGEKTLLKPVAQFDIRNDVEGFFPIDYQGVKIYMGDNKGLKHSWTDTDVINGKTYYYAVVSYDRGDSDLNMQPSECSHIILRDINGNVTLDKNTVEVRPQAPAAGYKDGGIQDTIVHSSGFATGNIWLDILDPLQIVDNQTFQVFFDDTSHIDTIAYSMINTTNTGQPDTIVNQSFAVRGEDPNPFFNGMRLFVFTDSIEWDADNSGWIQGDCNLPVSVEHKYHFSQRRPGYPSSYEIRVGVEDTSYWFGNPKFPVNFTVWDAYEDKKVMFKLEEPEEANRDSMISPGEIIRILIMEGSTQRIVWNINFKYPFFDAETILPDSGDVLKVQIKTPFRSGDVYRFTTKAAQIDRQIAVEELEKVAVVPNPYVAAARWEPPRLYATGRGERRIFFIHLPQECTIRIYTISGDLVQTLEHCSSMLDGSESWDLISKDGLDIAPGIYIYHIDAPAVGEKVGKFAIIK